MGIEDYPLNPLNYENEAHALISKRRIARILEKQIETDVPEDVREAKKLQLQASWQQVALRRERLMTGRMQ